MKRKRVYLVNTWIQIEWSVWDDHLCLQPVLSSSCFCMFLLPITPGKDRGPHLHWSEFWLFLISLNLVSFSVEDEGVFKPCCTDIACSSGKELSRAGVEATERVTQGRSGGAKGKSDFWKKSEGRRPLINKISGFEWLGFCMSNFHYQNFSGGKETGLWKQNPLGVSADYLKVKSIRTNFGM